MLLKDVYYLSFFFCVISDYVCMPLSETKQIRLSWIKTVSLKVMLVSLSSYYIEHPK